MIEINDNFANILSISPDLRSSQDISFIYSHLKSVEALKSYKNVTILEFAQIARYQRYTYLTTLYKRGEECKFWYIVLSGCVLVGKTMFFPQKSFGHRSQSNLFRYDDCLILEDTELIVIDYSTYDFIKYGSLNKRESFNSLIRPTMEISMESNSTLLDTPLTDLCIHTESKWSFQESDNSSVFSDCNPRSSLYDEDSSDVDCFSQDISLVNDILYDAIRKEPEQRSEIDIETILENINNLSTFTNFTTKTKYELCRVMHLHIVNNPGEKIISDRSILDTWNLIIDGTIEVHFKNGSVKEYSRGDSFGVLPSNEQQFQNGDIWTIAPFCLFFCVSQNDFCEIIRLNTETIKPETEENGHIVLVYEERRLSSVSSEFHKVIIKGTREKLINCLINDQANSDPMYLEDFFLTYRAFIKSPKILAEKLLQTFESADSVNDSALKSKIIKCILLWVNNHFIDFDDPKTEMTEYLLKFNKLFTEKSLSHEHRLFALACSKNSRKRNLTIKINEHYIKKLPFRLIGLYKNHGIFVNEINSEKFEESGLRCYDQIIVLANHYWKMLESLDKVLDILNSFSSYTIDVVVKYNPLGFQELLDDLSQSEYGNNFDTHNTQNTCAMSGCVNVGVVHDKSKNIFNSAMIRMELPRLNEFKVSSNPTVIKSSRSLRTSPNKIMVKKLSKQICYHVAENNFRNPPRSLKTYMGYTETKPTNSTYPNNLTNADQVIRVWRPNLENKLILISSNVTTKEALPLILKEFIIDQSDIGTYGLYLVSVNEDISNPMITISCVPLYLNDLAGRLTLNQRYYLKGRSDFTVITNDQAKSFLNEIKISLDQLTAYEIATRLTLMDYGYFRSIDAVEYINFILNLNELQGNDKTPNSISVISDSTSNSTEGFSTGCENYKKFQEKINLESFWPINEICSTNNINKRANLIKKFIKVAQICKELKNFNSVMSIITGLSLTPVRRLKYSWEKVPCKYKKIYQELYSLIDMSFNFRQIRQLQYPEINQPPIIPCLIIHTKDLANIHFSNKTCSKDGLINFEKLRMMAIEIRKLRTMCIIPYTLETILATVIMHNSPSFFTWSFPGTYFSVDDSEISNGNVNQNNNSDCNSKHTSFNPLDKFGALKNKYIKRRSSNASQCNNKNMRKIYEDWLTTLRVNTYLQNLNVEMKIDHLQEMSFALEHTESRIHSNTTSSESSIISNMFQSETTSKVKEEAECDNNNQQISEEELSKSIFSTKNQENVDKFFERVNVTLKKTEKPKLLSTERTDDDLDRTVANDQHFLRNIPIYQNDRITSLYVPRNVSDDLLEKTISKKEYNYPITGRHQSHSYYQVTSNQLVLPNNVTNKRTPPLRPSPFHSLSENQFLNQGLNFKNNPISRECQVFNFPPNLPIETKPNIPKSI